MVRGVKVLGVCCVILLSALGSLAATPQLADSVFISRDANSFRLHSRDTSTQRGSPPHIERNQAALARDRISSGP
jgi:hypothetical protein